MNSETNRVVLTNQQWDWIRKQLNERIRTCVDTRQDEYKRFVETVLWVAVRDLPWQSVQQGKGNWRAVYVRFLRWAESGVWDVLLEDGDGRLGTEFTGPLSRRLLMYKWRKRISRKDSDAATHDYDLKMARCQGR